MLRNPLPPSSGDLAVSAGSPAAASRDDAQRGLLTVIAGCMFSGKTTELLRRLKSTPHALAFKHAADSRFHATQIVSHAGKAHDAVALRDPAEIFSYLRSDTRLVVVDEGHFFEAAARGPGGIAAPLRMSLIQAAEDLAARGIDMVIAALQPDSWGRPFACVSRLLELADEPVVTYATCARCGARADRTQRLTPITNGQMVVSPDQYQPRCRACWGPPSEAPHAARHISHS